MPTYNTITKAELNALKVVTKTIAASTTTDVLFSEFSDTVTSDSIFQILKSDGSIAGVGLKVESTKIVITNDSPTVLTGAIIKAS